MANPTQYLIDPLTDRERDVLLAMADGMTNQQIANHLQLALATVKWYAGQIYSKLDVPGRQQAVARAQQLGLFDAGSIETTDTPHNLPQMTTPFIGRTRELADLHQRLNQEDTRLITIMAQGGTGKTRLAIALAERNHARFTDGLYLIQLAPIPSEGDVVMAVVTAIATVLGLQHYDDSVAMLDNLLRYLQTQHMLLILDNFEHLLAAGTVVSRILNTAPDVKIVVTSRERLRLRGEVVYSLYGLATGDDHNDEAMTLFLNSTGRIRPDYDLTDEDAIYIADICRMVEGLPLGIELAAGWMDTLSPQAIVQELQNSLDILETDLLDVPERHRSLHATFTYTWDSLSESEQHTMRTLSLFKGGITQEAARTVALADLRRLRLLVNKSLLHHDSQRDRYTIHELWRQFCFEKLLAAGDYDETVIGYSMYFAEMAQAHYEPMDRFIGEAFDAIRADWDNLAFAWGKMFAYRRYDLLHKTYQSLWLFSSMQGHSYECAALFEPVIAHLQSLDERTDDIMLLLAHLTIKYGDLLFGIDTHDRAYQVVARGIALAETLNHQSLQLLLAYNLRLYTCYPYEDFAGTKKYADAVIALATELDHHYFAINAHSILWQFDDLRDDVTAYQHSLDEAWRIWTEHCVPLIDQTPILRHTHFLTMFQELNREDEAIPILEEELARYEDAAWLYGISKVRSRLMVIVFEAEDYRAYGEHVLAILEWHKRHGRDWQLIGSMGGISGRAMYYAGNPDLAAIIAHMVIHHPIAVATQQHEAQWLLDTVRPLLDDERYQAAIAKADSLTLQSAYSLAITFWSDYIASHAAQG